MSKNKTLFATEPTAEPQQFRELYKELKGICIDNISEAEFDYFINHRTFTATAPKAKWIGKKADAWRFLHWIDPTETETNFNKWFDVYKNNGLQKKLFRNDKPNTLFHKQSLTDFEKILIRYKSK